MIPLPSLVSALCITALLSASHIIIAFLSASCIIPLISVPQIMILGPPAAGKRSISKMVAAKLRCTHLTPENLVQEADLKLRDQVEAIIASKNVSCRWCYYFVVVSCAIPPPPPPPSKCSIVFLSIIIMEICKASPRRLKVQNKGNITHTNVH